MGGKCLAGRGMPGSAARLSCSLPAAGGKLFLFAPGGRSWDEANPSKRGKVACKACKASVVHARPARPVLLEGLASSEAHGVMRERAAVDNRGVQRVAWAGPGGQKGRWQRARTCTSGLLPGDFSPHKAGRAWAVLNCKVWFWALRVKLVLAA